MTEKTYRQPSNGDSIVEFIRKTPLFSSKNAEDFHSIYQRCEERQYDKGVLIAHAKKKREGILLITSGLAEVYAAGYQHEREVLELAGPGEVVGLASLSTMLRDTDEPTNTVEIQALETTLGLFIPYAVLQEIWREEQVQAFFLEKAIFRLQDIYQSFTEQLQQSSWMDNQRQVFQRVQDLMSSPLLTLPFSSTMQDGIQFMNKNSLSAVVCLDSDKQPKVISMREIIKALAGGLPLSIPLVKIAEQPAVTIYRSSYYYDALTIFQQHPDLRHVVVLDERETPVGMLTLSDVLKQRHRSIQEVMKLINQLSPDKIEEAATQLKQVSQQLVEERESVRLISATMTPLYDQLVTKVIELAQEMVLKDTGKKRPCSFAFYQMGSAGRGEQLFMTDQDHFLVYETSNRENDFYFAEMGNRIVEMLERVGFKRCDGDMMSSNPIWRGSVEAWQQRIHRFATRSTPQNILYAYNFFAMRWISGTSSVHQSLMAEINSELKRSGVLIGQMGRELRSTMIPSMEHRIRSFILREGKEIDLKKQVLFPFHHSLQLKSLRHHIIEGSTVQRLEALRDQKKLTDESVEELKESIDLILYLNLQQKQKDQTSRVIIDDLSSREKALLSRALTVLREFQLTTLRELGI